MPKEKNFQFGWRILGLAAGLVLGHGIAYGLVIPPGYAFRYADRLAFVLVVCALTGIVIAEFAERWLNRFSIVDAWKMFILLAIAYHIVYGLGVMQAARE